MCRRDTEAPQLMEQTQAKVRLPPKSEKPSAVQTMQRREDLVMVELLQETRVVLLLLVSEAEKVRL
jgi:hypothetical protein